MNQMGRRRRKKDDDGLFDDLLDVCLKAAWRDPIVGWTIAAILVIAGLVLGNVSGPIKGFAVIIAILLEIIGVILALVSMVAFFIQRRSARPQSPRPRTEASSDPIVASEPSSDVPALANQPVAPPDRKPRDGAAFEMLIVNLYRRRGYVVDRVGTHGRGGDGGIDLLLRRPEWPVDMAQPVQCKDFADWYVGVERVRAFYGAVCARRAGQPGIFVTTSRFTKDARAFGEQVGLELIDGDNLAEMLTDASLPAEFADCTEDEKPQQRGANAPLCHRCKVPMLKLTARRGKYSGQAFWGCPNWCGARVHIGRE